jgi:predicted transcriptional regulator
MATLVEIAGQIVAAHATSNKLTTDELILEINKVHAALINLEAGLAVDGNSEAKPTMTLKEAFKKNEVVCMICGKGGFQTLARHLSTAHQMKSGGYKKQFGIPAKQKLSAKSYSESRRAIALERGLGDVLAKARETRMAKIESRKAAPAKTVKINTPAKVKAPSAVKAPAKAPKVKASPKAKK